MPHAIEPAARRLCAVLSIKVSGAKKAGRRNRIFPDRVKRVGAILLNSVSKTLCYARKMFVHCANVYYFYT